MTNIQTKTVCELLYKSGDYIDFLFTAKFKDSFNFLDK